jgi:uncharacterized protein
VKVVLDTNVVMSGIFFGGIPRAILSHWSKGGFELILSVEIFHEYEGVAEELDRKYKALEIDWKQVLRLIAWNGTIVDAQALKEQVCSDPDDDMFLACALSSGAHLIVSGDRQLCEASGWNGIEVLKPRDFYRRQMGDG